MHKLFKSGNIQWDMQIYFLIMKKYICTVHNIINSSLTLLLNINIMAVIALKTRPKILNFKTWLHLLMRMWFILRSEAPK